MSTGYVAVEEAGPRLLHAVFDLSRARQALLSVAQPALGAVIALGGLPSARQMLLGLVAATTGFLAVFSLNDVLDHKVDIRALAAGKAEFAGFDIDTVYSRHPIANGDIPLPLALVWVGGLAAVSAVAAYLLDPRCLAFFTAAVAAEVLYCALRSVTWAKTFVSGLMVGIGGLAGWAAVAALDARAVVFFAFLALWEIAGRNIPNDLADLVADRQTGIRTVATTFGERAAASATFLGSVATVATLGALAISNPGRALLVMTGLWAMVLPAGTLVAQPTSDQAGRFFNRASLLPALALPVVVVTLVIGL